MMSRGPVGKSWPTLLDVITARTVRGTPAVASFGATSSRATAGPFDHLEAISGISTSPRSHLSTSFACSSPPGSFSMTGMAWFAPTKRWLRCFPSESLRL